MALSVVVVGGWFGYQHLTRSACSGETTELTVAAAPEIAPVISATADEWTGSGAAVDGTCISVKVVSADPVDVAAAVATQHGVSLAGVGEASGAAERPDVWLPDSSIWLLRLRNEASGFAPTNAASVALSPIVVAMPEPVATAAGWPDKKLTWADLLKQITSGSGLRAGIVEPTRDAASLSGLLALGAATSKTGGDAQKATTAVLRALATGKSALREDLVARFPRSADPTSIASALNLAALSEEDVIAFNAKKPPIPLAALYLDPAPAPLDYPYAVMPGIDPVKTAAADKLFQELGTAAFLDRLGAQGLRAPDGSWGAGFTAPAGAPSPAGPPSTPISAAPEGGGKTPGPDPAVIDRVLSTWTAVTLPSRMLAVIDVSGSMFQKVPTANNATRMEVTIAAAQGGLNLFDDLWAVGLWTFSTQLDGNRDYRELVPIGPLSSQRSQLMRELTRIVPKRGGDTGLYDTMLAAYQTVQEGWEPGKINAVVMLTDGKNEDDDGISHAKLLAELKRLADPKRPIQVIIIGIGTGVSQSELEGITKVTGGGVFITEDPAKIGDIFLKAISLRPATVG
ncbi:MAG TPA: substrate-binding domain-containing protein [Micromonosporaceae bacterium]|nr:substrate-binding domain-containing protein [Micromonosporaceae bacterium]